MILVLVATNHFKTVEMHSGALSIFEKVNKEGNEGGGRRKGKGERRKSNKVSEKGERQINQKPRVHTRPIKLPTPFNPHSSFPISTISRPIPMNPCYLPTPPHKNKETSSTIQLAHSYKFPLLQPYFFMNHGISTA